MISILLFLCFLHSSQGCVGIAPTSIELRGENVNIREKCGEKIKLTFSQESKLTEFDIMLRGERSNCRVNERISALKRPSVIKATEGTCKLDITFTNNTLVIAAQDSICIQAILGMECSNEGDEEKGGKNFKRSNKENTSTVRKSLRSLGSGGMNKRSPGQEGALLSLGLSFILFTSIALTLLSCCHQRRKSYKMQSVVHDPEATGLTDYSYNSSHSETTMKSSCSTRRSMGECSNNFYPMLSSSPVNIALNPISPQSHITYLSPALLNIPDIPPTMPPPRNSKISLSPEHMTNLSHSDTSDTFSIDHRREQGNYKQTEELVGGHHAVLEGLANSRQGAEERRDSGQMQRERISSGTTEATSTSQNHSYFVLDITIPTLTPAEEAGDEVNEDTPIEEPVPSRIYHVLDPVSLATSDSPPICSVCHNPINQNEDESIYLVILPNEDESVTSSSEQEESSDATLAEDDPIYQVLEQPSLICQSCLCTEGEPIYHELERSPGKCGMNPIYERVKNIMRQGTSLNSEGSSSHLYSTVTSLDIPDPNCSNLDVNSSVRRVHLKHAESSGDYASIPDDIDPPENHAYPQRDKPHTEKTRANRGAGLGTLTRSHSQTQYTPLIIAQRKKSGSYHVLNVDEIWRHQQANRYAPVSIVMRKQSQNIGVPRKGASMKSRRSYIRDQIIEAPVYHSDYEVPVSLRAPPTTGSEAAPTEIISIPPMTGSQVIPPPSVLRESRKFSRQDALGGDPEHFANKKRSMFAMRSEPSLSVSIASNEYDHLEFLSHASSSPLPPPISSSKNPFKKSFSNPYSQLHRKSSDAKACPQRTPLLSESEGEEEGEAGR